jgi:serine protease
MHSIRRCLGTGVRVALAFAAVGATAAAEPYGSAFQVDTFSSPTLSTPSVPSVFAVATADNGDSTVLWQSGGGTGRNFIQRYDAAGRPLQAQEWDIGTGVRAVAMGGPGKFVLLRRVTDGSGSGVFATVCDRAGNIIVPEFRANDAVAGDQEPVAVAMNAAGQFVALWKVFSSGFVSALHAKAFQANGAAAGPETIVVSRSGSDYILNPLLDIDATGRFVVTWDMGDILTDAWTEVWARRFERTGAPSSGAVRVNTRTAGGQHVGGVDMNASGAFVIVWEGSAGTNDVGVYVQRFGASGISLGGETRVDVGPSNGPEGFDVAMASDGSFVVTWTGPTGTPSSLAQIMSRAYASNGAPIGVPFVVSAATNVFATAPQIGTDPSGNTFIVWLQHHFTNDASNAVMARRYSPAGAAVQPLANGQTIANLSGVTGSWRYFKITMPTGPTTFEASTFGGTGDADLYVRWGALPTLDAWDGRPYLDGNNEGVRMLNYPAGDWYVGVYGFASYAGLSVSGSSR